MAQTRGVVPALYDNVDKTMWNVFKDELNELPRIYTTLFNMEKSDRKFERHVSYALFTESPLKPEGADYSTQLIQQGYTKDFTHLEFGLGFEVTQTAQEDDVYDVINQYGTGLARSCRVTQEVYGASVLNDGFTTETTPDGVSLFNTAHPLVTGGTARNRRDAALSYTSLQQAMIDIYNDQKSDEGFFTNPVMGLDLWVPPALMMTAYRLVDSTGLPSSADNDINPLNMKYSITVRVNPYLGAGAGGSDTAWFLTYKGKKTGLISYTRVAITMQPPERLPKSGNRFYAARFRASWGARGWQGTYGSAGA